MKKILFASDIFTPHQNELNRELNKRCSAIFYFYDAPDKTRGAFWNVTKAKDVIISKKIHGVEKLFELQSVIRNFRPDHVVLGGFYRYVNFLIYLICKSKRINVSVATERLRGEDGKLIKKGLHIFIIKYLYSGLKNIFVTEEDALEQFKCFNLPTNVDVLRYCTYLEFDKQKYGRKKKSILFANRLTEIYNPRYAIEVFKKIVQLDNEYVMYMNNSGELKDVIVEKIREYKLEDNITFLDDIKCWNDVTMLYTKLEYLFLPARFSNSNFSIIEAMASRMKIIISDNVLGVGAYINNMENGYKIPLDNLDEYVNAFMAFKLQVKDWENKNEQIASIYNKESVANQWLLKL